MTTSHDVAALRDREYAWMANDPAIFLNAASVGPMPAAAVEVAHTWSRMRAQPHALPFQWMLDAASTARSQFAALVGADANEIALMPNTTYGLNLAARALPLRPGTILTFDGEFPSCVYPFQALGARGITLELIPRAHGLPNEDALVAAIGLVASVLAVPNVGRFPVVVMLGSLVGADLAVFGFVTVELAVASDAPDTDFTVKLVDVAPDGTAWNISDTIQRMRYRNGEDKPEFMNPGETYLIRPPPMLVANVFEQGHSIRVEVSSSNFPTYARNLNTANDPYTSTEIRIANNQVLHGPTGRSSLIILPVATLPPP
jgi:hypothetical protein